MEFATGALGTLLPKLGQLLLDEYNLQKGTKKNIEFLKKELESTQAALCSVGEVPPEQLKEQDKIWARDVRELSYDMEDIVDTFLVRVHGPEPPSKRSAKRFIKKMMSIVTKATTRHEISQEIKDIKERVKEVATRRDRYKVDAIAPPKTIVDPRIASLYSDAANLVGIDEAREELITRLTKDAPSAQKKIVSVVGFGGLGKTTLATAVYDKLKGQFDCTAFVPVGRNPDLKKVFKDILIDLHQQGYMHFNLDILDERQLIKKLRESLEKKRYFIVIDDVWEAQTWQTIKLALVENNSGSRIIITSRKHEVAREAGEVYDLQPLSDDNSRKLFFATIFGAESKSSDHQPDDVSDKILRKCGGIPLAIITMASVLVGKRRDEWSEVHRSIGFGSKENQQLENTMKILSFSYYDLPSHLRACLLHLSVFPEDCSIEKGPLIWMWIAEGFVHGKKGISSFEIGEGYFNELVNRSMILAVEWIEHGMVVHGCQVHDMVLDLICSISSEENFITVLDGDTHEGASSSQGRVRRLALRKNNRTVEAHMDGIQQVRSFISWGCDIDKGIPLSCFKLIRVLAIDTPKCMERCHLEHLRNLLHLRYLQLCGGGDVELPEEIGTLTSLQTLDLKGFSLGKVVTRSMGLPTQLLCLRLRDPVFLEPGGIVGKLASLEELHLHCINCHGESVGAVKELVRGMEAVTMLSATVSLYIANALRAFQQPVEWEAADLVLSRHLRRLFLNWTSFSRFPSFCINPTRLPNLSHLVLHVNAIDDQDLRILGELPQLYFLDLRVMCTTQVVVCSNTTTTSFQKLRRCCMWSREVQFKDDSGGVSLRMQCMEAERKGTVRAACSVAPTLMPSFENLQFVARVSQYGGGCSSRLIDGLEYFASLQNVGVIIECDGASAAEVEEVEAALRHAVDVHPNRPTLDLFRVNEEAMVISAAKPQEQAGTSGGG